MKPRQLTAGQIRLLEALKSEANYDHGGLRRAIRVVEDCKQIVSTRESELQAAKNHLETCEQELKDHKKIVAQICNDLGKLGCTIDEIRDKWPGYCAHDVAEWLQY